MDLNKEINSFLSLPESSFNEAIDNEELQRTEAWKEERRGNFTGSSMGKLMTCKSRAKGKNFGELKWILDFGDSALTYIIERAIERATGQSIEVPDVWQMRWGRMYEDEGKAYFENIEGVKLEDVGFEKFYKNAGASPDGYFYDFDEHQQRVKYAFELKCPATVNSHYNLMNTPVDESHPYFWQVVTEMLSLGTGMAMFATYDTRYPEGAKLGRFNVYQSETHIKALKTRIILAEKLVNIIIDKDFRVDARNVLTGLIAEVPADYSELEDWIHINERPLLL